MLSVLCETYGRSGRTGLQITHDSSDGYLSQPLRVARAFSYLAYRGQVDTAVWAFGDQ